MKRILPLVLFICCATMAHSQHIHLFGNESRSAMYFNLDRLWSYNLYEQSTWGGGLHFVIFTPFTFANRREYNLYVNYSPHINQWKYGMGVAYRLRRSRSGGTLYVSVAHDYFTAAGRSLDDASRCDMGSTSTFMTQRMEEQYVFTAGYSFEIGDAVVSIDGRWHKGWRLFDADGMRYRTDSTTVVREDGQVYRVRVDIPCGVIVQLQTGLVEKRSFARLIGQFYQDIEMGAVSLGVYAQCGLASNGAPYTYLFDLGGSYGGPVCYDNSLLTARPNEFTANAYGVAALRFHPTKPIFKLYSRLFHIGTMPMPYVGVKAMWGHLHGQDADGSASVDGLALQSPHHGIAEGAIGVDDILRWGSTSWGVAAAYRVAPKGVPYHYETMEERVALMITAKVVL